MTTHEVPFEIDDGEQEGWMVAYADLITLLFIFFALMLSISAVSRMKFDRLSSELNKSSTTSLSQLKQQLDAEVQAQGLGSQVVTQMTDEGLQVEFNESLLFGSGDAVVNPAGQSALRSLGLILSPKVSDQFALAVEGHTDSRPIQTREFPSNWALSSARAVNVLHFLSTLGIPERRMTVRAYADTRPIAAPTDASASSEAWARNRRVTLLVY